MKKSAFVPVLMVGSFLFSTPLLALAAPDPNGGGTSQGTVVFEPNTKVTPPVITPTTPTNPDDPNKNPDEPTGNTTPLRVDLVPNFFFGKWTIGTGNHTAVPNTRANSNLQVTDGRGTLQGWVVSVARTEFKNEENLLATTFTLTPGKVKNGTNQTITLPGNVTAPVTVNTTKQPIFSAASKEGGGTYVQTFDGADATLTFDSNKAYAGEYQSTLTWTIETAVPAGAF